MNNNQSIKARLTSVIALLSLLLLLIGGMGLFGMYRSNEALRLVYEDRTLGISQISQVDRLILRNRLPLEESIIDPTPELVRKKVAEAEANIAEISQIWETFQKHELAPEEAELARQFAEARQQFVQQGLKVALEHLKRDEAHIAMQVDTEQVQRLYPAVKGDEGGPGARVVDRSHVAAEHPFWHAQAGRDLLKARADERRRLLHLLQCVHFEVFAELQPDDAARLRAGRAFVKSGLV